MRNLLLLLVIPWALAASEVKPLEPLAEPRPAPAFSFPDMEGHTHQLDDYAGQVLVINFWATWCPPCVREMPALDRLQNELADDGVVVFGANLGETPEDIAEFSQQVPVDFPLLLDPDMSAGMEWGVRGLPTTYIIDGRGRILFEVLGDKHWDDPIIVEQIRALVD